jgi:3-phenylpropionate/trans-cinnamate dioxygenase ferredoxin reductase subunit
VLLESVQNAVSQGKLCAAAILGQDAQYAEPPWFWSEQYDCRLQMAGLPAAGDELVLRDNGPNSLTVLSVSPERLNAIQCINAPRDYMAARKLISAQTPLDMQSLQDPETELKDLL